VAPERSCHTLHVAPVAYRYALTVQQGQPGIKRHVVIFLWVLILPVTLGVLTPFIEASWLFAEDGWWRSLTIDQQLAFAVRWSLRWVLLLTGLALLISFFSRRWRESFWKSLFTIVVGVFRVIRAIISLIGFALVSQKDLDRRIEAEIQAREKRATAAGPPKGTPSRTPGITFYGDVFTSQNIYDSTLTVTWRTNNLPFGQLIPSPGSTWQVHYGHVESAYQPFFIKEEDLGRVTEIWEGVDWLRKRDLRER
jgi:hypothetical protein